MSGADVPRDALQTAGTADVTATITVVVPSVGRPSLGRAVRSALDQSHPVDEVIVVLDTDYAIQLPDDPRIVVLHTSVRDSGAARQVGIDAARGDVIAMLDDDDEWLGDKLQQQLQFVGPDPGEQWIASSRMSVRGPGSRRRVWPRRLIEPGQSVADYLFRFTGLRAGAAELQSSTLVFPTDLGRTVRWDHQGGSPQDEPSWLIRVQRALPDLRIVHAPMVLSLYHVDGPSVSRQSSDRARSYVRWGLQHLGDEPKRVLGDYLCTYPVSAAVSAGSIRGVLASVAAAVRHGRPGGFALLYATLNAVRIVAGSMRPQRSHE